MLSQNTHRYIIAGTQWKVIAKKVQVLLLVETHGKEHVGFIDSCKHFLVSLSVDWNKMNIPLEDCDTDAVLSQRKKKNNITIYTFVRKKNKKPATLLLWKRNDSSSSSFVIQ